MGADIRAHWKVQNKKQKRPIAKKLRPKNKQEVGTPIDLKETSIKRKIRPILEKVKTTSVVATTSHNDQ